MVSTWVMSKPVTPYIIRNYSFPPAPAPKATLPASFAGYLGWPAPASADAADLAIASPDVPESGDASLAASTFYSPPREFPGDVASAHLGRRSDVQRRSRFLRFR